MSSNIGLLLYGFCNGYFGRDSYHTKRIEGEGEDWIVARALEANAKPEFAQFYNPLQKWCYIQEWSKDTEEEE